MSGPGSLGVLPNQQHCPLHGPQTTDLLRSGGMHRAGRVSPAGYTRLTESEQEYEVRGPRQGGKDQRTGAREP